MRSSGSGVEERRAERNDHHSHLRESRSGSVIVLAQQTGRITASRVPVAWRSHEFAAPRRSRSSPGIPSSAARAHPAPPRGRLPPGWSIEEVGGGDRVGLVEEADLAVCLGGPGGIEGGSNLGIAQGGEQPAVSPSGRWATRLTGQRFRADPARANEVRGRGMSQLRRSDCHRVMGQFLPF